MFIANFYFLFILIINSINTSLTNKFNTSVTFSKVWGPGLKPHILTMPARYFFIQAVDSENKM